MVITAMKQNQKNLQNERFSCSFLKVRTNIDLWTKRLIKASKILCMGCHPHTKVNPAWNTERKETQEPM